MIVILPGSFTDLMINKKLFRILRVISGDGLLSLDNTAINLSVGKMVKIPMGSRYRVFNIHKDKPMEIEVLG